MCLGNSFAEGSKDVASGEGSLSVAKMTCEYVVNPLGIDVDRPRFSWTLESTRRGQLQSAYQVLVADNETLLALNEGNKWDIGKVVSGKSRSGHRCWETWNMRKHRL